MSKKSRKKRKSPPPLSGLDKLIYGVLIALSAALLIFLVVAVHRFKQFVAFGDETTVAFANRLGTLLALPFFLYLGISLFVVFTLALGNKKPIFGNKKIRYGQYPWPEELYPLFDERRKIRYKRPSRTRFVKAMLRLWLVGFLITLALTPFALFGRNSLHQDGTISVHNAFNSVLRDYTPEDCESMTLSIRFHRYRKSLHGYWAYSMGIVALDGTYFHFDPGDFTDIDSCLDMILKLKSMFPDSKLNIKGAEHLDLLTEELNYYSKENISKLRAIFLD